MVTEAKSEWEGSVRAHLTEKPTSCIRKATLCVTERIHANLSKERCSCEQMGNIRGRNTHSRSLLMKKNYRKSKPTSKCNFSRVGDCLVLLEFIHICKGADCHVFLINWSLLNINMYVRESSLSSEAEKWACNLTFQVEAVIERGYMAIK